MRHSTSMSPSDSMWRHWTGSTLAPSHYMKMLTHHRWGQCHSNLSGPMTLQILFYKGNRCTMFENVKLHPSVRFLNIHVCQNSLLRSRLLTLKESVTWKKFGQTVFVLNHINNSIFTMSSQRTLPDIIYKFLLTYGSQVKWHQDVPPLVSGVLPAIDTRIATGNNHIWRCFSWTLRRRLIHTLVLVPISQGVYDLKIVILKNPLCPNFCL